MTRRYVMCFTVHYQKKLGRKKTQTGSPKQPISPEGRLWRGSPGLIVEFSAYLAAMLPCFLMSSHVIPCYPKMAKRRKYGNWKFWDYPNHPILSRVAISSHLVTSKNGQTLPRRDANILVHLGPMLQVLQIAGTLPRVHSRRVGG